MRLAGRRAIAGGRLERRDGALREPLFPERLPARQILASRRLCERSDSHHDEQRDATHHQLPFAPGSEFLALAPSLY